ncbi:MAG: hypothetical protein Q9167_001805 [Letrouitia subvulpina]
MGTSHPFAIAQKTQAQQRQKKKRFRQTKFPEKTMPVSQDQQQPQGWTLAMRTFLRRVLANGEDTKSAIILLETEYPQLVGKVNEGWVDKVRREG